MNPRVVTLDRFTSTVLTVLTVLLTVIMIELWVGAGEMPHARAQIPDTGLQRKEIVDEARQTNQLLREILEHLKTKPIKVVMGSADKHNTDRLAPARP